MCLDSLVGKCRPDFGTTPGHPERKPRDPVEVTFKVSQWDPSTLLGTTSASAITLRPRARPRDSPGLSFRRALPRFVAKGPDQFQTRPVWS